MPAQPNNSWSVQVLNANGTPNGAAQTFASLGIESATYELVNLAPDVLTFTVGGRNLDASALWPYGTLLAVLNPSNVRFFVGRVEPWSREGRSDAQNHIGRLVNPWWYLDHLLYQQTYQIVNPNGDGVISYTTYQTTRTVLNVLWNNATQKFTNANTGQQIAAVLAWAISQGAPIAIGQMDPATLPFSHYEQGIICSAAIKMMFRYEPDFVVDWDYTTLPFPTMHCRKMASVVPVLIDLTNPVLREQVTVKERNDWQKTFVRISYDQTSSINGNQYLTILQDWYSAAGQGYNDNTTVSGVPIPGDVNTLFGGVDLFCDLQGANVTTTSQTAEFSSQPFDITSLASWTDWKPSLAAGTVAQSVIMTPQSTPQADATRPAPTIQCIDELDANGNPVPYDETNAYEVIDGQWADWIPNVTGQRVRVTAWAQIINKSGEVKYEQQTHDMTVVSIDTNSQNASFKQTSATIQAYAEVAPLGLAKAMYTSWQNLSIEGSLVNVEAVIGASIVLTRSNCLNFLTTNPGQNGQPDWRNVNALVQRISGDILRGQTKVQFGAPLHLTGNELIDAIRATRYRVTGIDLNYLFGGALGGGSSSNVSLGRKTHARSSQGGGTHTQDHVASAAVQPTAGVDAVVKTTGGNGVTTWSPPGSPGSPSPVNIVTIDPSATKGSDGKFHAVTLQEIPFCVANPDGSYTQKRVIALISAPY